MKYVAFLVMAVAIFFTNCSDDDEATLPSFAILANANWPREVAEESGGGFSSGGGGSRSGPVSDIPPGTNTLRLYFKLLNKPSDKDVTITLKVDTDVVAEYNAMFGDTSQSLPEQYYSLDAAGLTQTVPAGTTDAEMEITLYPDMFNESDSYILALTITDAGQYGLSSNLRSVVFRLNGEDDDGGMGG